ncbi:MAG: sulfite exporter TauE/SafE family protein [Nitrososphaerota archaeon]|jgi:thiol:disulfide interchange protein DsbD|uniref:sulfite exporter TauE/SafE family protein n=1 Tax=Candidatus Bathycorpusculum sp. TaxID=2994959 RepID=UPI002817DB47|nr:sulfite exporter TauE/SafE family protein [Candidatus Termiticorpusculum sp.]MCL2292018.1 sulfite exporter TauE/SafE family protein [Candidatus Termiticorpusculum sp.]MDR0460603.1 sulfite exporter TauE/SafE family protein [Nitrososphaerota archaeon]
MSLVELSNPYLTSFASGLLYGLVACTATCLPYLASYIAGTGANFRQSFFTTLTFNSGRIIAYTLIGATISLFSGLLHLLADAEAFLVFQAYSTIAFSIVTILIGGILLYKNKKPSCNCNNIPPLKSNPTPPVNNSKIQIIRRFDVGAFTLGLSRGLVLCPPLIAFLLYSIPFASPLDSIAFAALFGLGTAISPMLLIGSVTGWLLNKADLLRRYITIAGAIIIIILGLSTLISSLLSLI